MFSPCLSPRWTFLFLENSWDFFTFNLFFMMLRPYDLPVGTRLGTEGCSHTPGFQTAALWVGSVRIPSNFLSMITGGWTSKSAWDLIPASFWSVLRQAEHISNYWGPNLVVFCTNIWNTPLIWAPANYPQAWLFLPQGSGFPRGSNTPSGSAFTAPHAWPVGFLPQPVSAATQLGKALGHSVLLGPCSIMSPSRRQQ